MKTVLSLSLGFQWQRSTERRKADVRRLLSVGVRTRQAVSRHSPHQLETYAQMIPKVEVVQHVDDVVG